ncbi:efflux RND transporter permease subunit [Leucobacter ruminantium]|uniref:Efflux RND transporter permease subunit n=1 Tax=Leucobacter ruminantium TaxID=1289170 RepID=A0A939S0C6_9MICO|nr:efflux RND transporter permease subunit [Leucobacter ruminantium]MBO1806379.1 efflux RND transporter permease subunit [Leucobacter ruminantium]
MQQLTALSLKNRALIALVTIVAAVFGLLSVGSLKQELMPSVEFPAIAVVTNYPGASPEVVNKDVSGPIETALRGVPQLESSTATSSTGASMVVAQFSYGIDIAATEQKVERAISRISDFLPSTADPQVLSGSIDDFPVIQIAVTPAEGETPEQAAETVERVAISELSDLDGVREAQLTGARENRITIEPDLEALAAQGLAPQAIGDTLQQSGALMAAGTVTEGDRTLAVQAGSEVGTPEDVAALPIVGSTATIGSVADVRLEPGPEQSISRVNGAPALTIAVTKMSAANTVDVSHAVQEKLDELSDQLGGAKLSIIFDQAPYVEQSIHTLTTEGLLGLLFAVLVILVFLMSVRATFVTAISIPTSVLLTFIGLNFAEYTLNMLTLGALTISIGRVVDDSIVVIENIKRHLAAGGDRAATIIEAVREVAGAITASTVTTVAVFLPMAFVDGMVGELFRPFAFTVTIALAASLLVSLTIVPVLAYWFLRPDRAKAGDRDPSSESARRHPHAAAVSEGEQAKPTRLQRGYRPIIEWTLRGAGPAITLGLAAVVFIGTMAATPLMKTNYMGEDEQNSVGLVQTLAPGTSLDAQLAQVQRVEDALDGVEGVDTVQVTIGSAGDGMSAIFGGGGDGAISYSLTTDPDANQAEVKERIREAVDALDDAGEFSLGRSGGGVTTSSAIEVSVTAPDQQTLAQASDLVLAELQKQDGLEQVESDLAQSRPYLRVAVDRAAAAAVGLGETAVAAQLAQQMQPQQIGQITMDASTVAVYLAVGTPPVDQAGVAALPIQTALGPVPLGELALVEVADGPVTVRTEDGARMVTVSALPKGDDLGTAGLEVDAALESVKLPAGASASIGGVMSQQSEAFGQLGLALLVAILIVYVVMVATFRSLLQPLLLLISVPFAATGALLLLIATGIPLGVASLIGVLMLIGIVVTNAIVLVDLVNQYRARGDALRDAVLHGSMQRLRPIVMTALATILALTPMGLGITGKGGFISQPLAVVVIGGLLSSTVLTLIVLPTLYYIVERARERGRERRARRRSGERLGAETGQQQPGKLHAGGVPTPAHGLPAVAPAFAGAAVPVAAAPNAAAPAAVSAGPHSASATRDERDAAVRDERDAVSATEGEGSGGGETPPPADSDSAVDAEPDSGAAPVEGASSAEGIVDAEGTVDAELAPRPALHLEPADAETRQRILENLMRAGLAAPELRRSSGGSQTDLGRAADDRVAADDTDETGAGAGAGGHPQGDEPDGDLGPATEQMALALGELGFVGEHDPLRDERDEVAEHAGGSRTDDIEADEAEVDSTDTGDTEVDSTDTDSTDTDSTEVDEADSAEVDDADSAETAGSDADDDFIGWDELLRRAMHDAEAAEAAEAAADAEGIEAEDTDDERGGR